MAKKTKEQKELEENLKDPTYVNYNLLLKLEEIKNINYSILTILNAFYKKGIKEEGREGTFKSK